MRDDQTDDTTAMAHELFAGLSHDEEFALAPLRTRLVRQAEEADLLDVAYSTLDTPVGRLLLAATERGLVRISYGWNGYEQVLEELATHLSPRILRSPQRLSAAERELDEYFEGERTEFDLTLDLSLASGFRRDVLSVLATIPYGNTKSYAGVAAAAGNPRAVRAVGTACRLNPLPIVIPCHRVLKSDGSIGGYAGGLDVKRRLLALESGNPPANDPAA